MCIASVELGALVLPGHAISFACEQYAYNLQEIEEYIEHSIPLSHYDKSALLDDIKAPKMIKRRGPQGRSRNGGRGLGQNRRRQPR